MTIYTITTSNYNDPAYWAAISETSAGHTLDFSHLPASYTVYSDADNGRITIVNDSGRFTIGESAVADTHANFGPGTEMSFFTVQTANDSGSYIVAGNNDDSITGGAGNDTIKLRDGNNYGEGGAGNDRIKGGSGSDSIRGGAGDDTIASGGGDDNVSGGDDADVFVIDDHHGNDTISGGEGGSDSDTIDMTHMSSAVTVTYTGNEAGTIVDNGDTITFSGIEALKTGSGDDSIDAGNDSVGALLDAGAGSDTIIGGAGDDHITTGTGSDVVVMETSGGRDSIADFDLSDDDGDGFFRDQLDVSDLTGGSGPGGLVNVNDVVVTDDGIGNAVLTFPGGEQLVLKGISTTQISSYPQLYSAGIPCFTPGALIETEHGPQPVERIKVGTRVQTADNGLRAVIWTGRRQLCGAELARAPQRRPIAIAAGSAFGNRRPMLVSPQHRIILPAAARDGQSHQPAEPGQFLRARLALDLPQCAARRVDGLSALTYIHLMTEEHQVIFADGCATETFWPGPEALRGLSLQTLRELLGLFPELSGAFVLRGDAGRAQTQSAYGDLARPELRRRDLPPGTPSVATCDLLPFSIP